MTVIKLCGLKRIEDIRVVNVLKPDYIGFIFVEKSKRYINPIQAYELKKSLDKNLKVVGVFVDEEIEIINDMFNMGIIDLAQLHGHEDEGYIKTLKDLSHKPIIKAFRIDSKEDVLKAEKSSADFILLDSGTGGTGSSFDWSLIKDLKRDYFLAGGLNNENISDALKTLKPYAVDVSSGIETDGFKDRDKMNEFVEKVRSVNI